MATVEQVCVYNQTNINWNKFFSVVDTLGTTMNGQKDRFDKSDIIEMALSVYSNDTIEYVNNDGVDHRLLNLPNNEGTPTEQEMKFVSQVFYGMRVVQRKTKKQPKIEELVKLNKPVTLKLVNSMGSNSHKDLPATYAEFLMVVDNYSAHVIATEDLKPYLKFGGDGIEAKNVPCNLFVEVVGPDDLANRRALTNFNYKQAKIEFQRNFLAQF